MKTALLDHAFGIRLEGWTYHDIMNNAAEVRAHLYLNKLLLIKGLHDLTPDQYWDMHAVFGTPWIAPEYRMSHELHVATPQGRAYTLYTNRSKLLGNQEMLWHRDIPFHRAIRYPLRSLYPVELPIGAPGATKFTDTARLWQVLSETEHEILHNTELTIQSWYAAMLNHEHVPKIQIPLVEQHPITGEQTIMLNSFGPRLGRARLPHASNQRGSWILDAQYAGKSLGLDWLNRMHALFVVPENIYEHHWQRGDFIIFDNASGIMHGRDAIPGDPLQVGARSFWRMNVKHNYQLEPDYK